MEYIIRDNLLILKKKNSSYKNSLTVEIISIDNVKEKADDYDFIKETKNKFNNISVPKTETFNHYYFVALPINEDAFSDYHTFDTFEFIIYILKNKIVFLGDSEDIYLMIQEAIKKQYRPANSLEDIVSFVFQWVLGNEQNYIEVLEDKIEKLESDIISDKVKGFNEKIMMLRKRILFANHYYEQFIDLISECIENEIDLFSEDNISKFENTLSKAERLTKKTEMLQAYTLQLREMYQAQIDIDQNKVMQILTVVTTIFAPLTLITGWFGMNFEHMAFLKFKHAYPITFITSLSISLLLIIYFKKKKFF